MTLAFQGLLGTFEPVRLTTSWHPITTARDPSPIMDRIIRPWCQASMGFDGFTPWIGLALVAPGPRGRPPRGLAIRSRSAAVAASTDQAAAGWSLPWSVASLAGRGHDRVSIARVSGRSPQPTRMQVARGHRPPAEKGAEACRWLPSPVACKAIWQQFM